MSQNVSALRKYIKKNGTENDSGNCVIRKVYADSSTNYVSSNQIILYLISQYRIVRKEYYSQKQALFYDDCRNRYEMDSRI